MKAGGGTKIGQYEAGVGTRGGRGQAGKTGHKVQ
jgi:hypothetical protein